MARNSLVAYAQEQLDEARRASRHAVDNFNISDDEVLELRANARRALEELKELDRKAAKGGFFGFLVIASIVTAVILGGVMLFLQR